jgi:LPXTG-motif cell wall-anchored protein
MRKRTSWVMIALGMLLALAIVPATFAQPGMAKVRVVHASPDAPAVDVYVDGNKVLTNVPFFTASDYLDVPAGPHDLKVTPTGEPNTAVIDAKGVTVESGRAYTVAATGRLAEIKPAILADNLSAPAAGKAHVRVVHFSQDAPAVDIKVKGGPTLIPNLAFPNASDYLPVDANTYDIVVTPAGTDTVALDLAGTKLDSGKIYDVFAVGLLNGEPKLRVEVVTPAPQTSAVPAPAAAQSQPQQLPRTAGEATPLALFALLAALLLGGGLLLRRRAR